MVTYTFTSLKDCRTSMLVKKQLYLFVFQLLVALWLPWIFTLAGFYLGFRKYSLEHLDHLFWNFIPVLLFEFCSFFVNSRWHFSFSTKASASAFSILLKKAFWNSLASMSAFNFNLLTIRLVGFRTKVVCYLESLFSSLKNLKLFQEIFPGQLRSMHKNHACYTLNIRVGLYNCLNWIMTII